MATSSDDDSKLIVRLLTDKEAYNILEFMYINNNISFKDAKLQCNVHKMQDLIDYGLVEKRHKKRGKYIFSWYHIKPVGRDIFELTSYFKRSD